MITPYYMGQVLSKGKKLVTTDDIINYYTHLFWFVIVGTNRDFVMGKNLLRDEQGSISMRKEVSVFVGGKWFKFDQSALKIVATLADGAVTHEWEELELDSAMIHIEALMWKALIDDL